MRISTNTFYDNGASRMTDIQSRLAKTQEQLSTGRRFLTPADDPVGTSQVLVTGQALAVNTQFAVNRQNSITALTLEESALANIADLLQNSKTLMINAGNGVMSDLDRASLADTLSGNLDQLISLANTKDGQGNSIFAGYQTAADAFVATSTGASYQGDQGQHKMQVSISRQIFTSDSGDTVFERNIKAVTSLPSVAPLNTGNATISQGLVSNASSVNGHSYQIVFTSPTLYDVYDTTIGGQPISASNAYGDGQDITVGGIQFAISGSPSVNDVFNVNSQGNQSVFAAFKEAINLLKVPGIAGLKEGLARGNSYMDQAIDNNLTVRGSVGARLKELELLDDAGRDRDIQYQQVLSNLQDLDYIKAVTTLSQQKTTLDAAQMSFAKISGLSLFNYLR
jgi:flagellar hook-associated protein 3 FlgL